MTERYSFRLTRKTKWVSEIIDAIPHQDKSDFLRECFIEGLKLMPEYQVYLAQQNEPMSLQTKITPAPKLESQTKPEPKKIVLERIEISENEMEDRLDKLSSRFD